MPQISYVRHGSLFVDAKIDEQFRLAEAYLRNDSGMKRTFDDLESGRKPVYVDRIGGGADEFSVRGDGRAVVDWDPYSALRTTSGGRQSPALGLGHELAHADEPDSVRAAFAAVPDFRYDNGEERRVIRGIETHAAKSLGEGVRTDHRGSVYHVPSATSR